ncbi:DUF2087 domain-containing protein [Streptacidiphilus anmyonensis]|uniref:DUF2087 domain-containing protein n=1 Tax=Streptacidiphilus anmyonensis TaxID=405782 RepID=UPI0005A76453
MPDIALLAPLASALSDRDRLVAFARVVLAGEEGVEAAALGRHGARLEQVGLVEAREGRVHARTEAFAEAMRGPARTEASEVAQLFKDGRLTEMPTRPARRLAVLAHLTDRAFERGVSYSEPEVNIALKQYWDDCAALRRYLVENGFLTRSADGTSYRVSAAGA